MRYCEKCGDHEHGDKPCNPTSLETMRRNPGLSSLVKSINADPQSLGNPDFPVILGGGPTTGPNRDKNRYEWGDGFE